MFNIKHFLNAASFSSVCYHDLNYLHSNRFTAKQQSIKSSSILTYHQLHWIKLHHSNHDIETQVNELSISDIQSDRDFLLHSYLSSLTVIINWCINLHIMWSWMIFQSKASQKNQHSSDSKHHSEWSTVS